MDRCNLTMAHCASLNEIFVSQPATTAEHRPQVSLTLRKAATTENRPNIDA